MDGQAVLLTGGGDTGVKESKMALENVSDVERRVWEGRLYVHICPTYSKTIYADSF